MPPFLQADEATISSITYYLQNELPQQAVILIEEKIRANPRDPLLLFWQACSIGSSGLQEQAIELLQRLQKSRTHISHSIKNAISHFKSTREKPSSTLGVGSGTAFTSQFDSIDEAVLYVAFNLFVKKDSMEALRILDGFVTAKHFSNESLLCGFSVPALYANATVDNVKNDLLQDVIKYSDNSLSCLFTLATIFDTKGDVEKSLTYLNRTISRDNSFVPAYLEKTKALISLGKLELAGENCQRTIACCGNDNYEALLLHLLTEMLINGVCKQTLAQINELSSCFLKMKPPNPRYYFEFAVLFSRLSDQSADVLQITSGILKRTCELSIEHEKYRVEYIHHTRFLGIYDEAVEQYERGLENESENQIDLIKGLLLSLIALGNHKEAKNRLDFFSVTHEELSLFPEMNVIRALLSICQNDDVDANISSIRQFVETSNSSKVDTNESVVKKLLGIDPQFLFEVAKELIATKSSCSLVALDSGNKVVELGLEILRKIMCVYRGSLRASLTLAKAFIDTHRYESALNVLADCKISHAQSSLVYLLCAKASVAGEHYSDAKSELEQAMSLDFSISKHLLYKYCESMILIDEGRDEMAKEILKDCLRDGRKSDSTTGDCDALNCYYMLASIFMKSKDIKAAKDILIAAYDAFKGSALEIDALIQLSRFLVNDGDIQEGVKILGSVKKAPMMVKAQIELADVFLNNIGNRKEYIKCFQRILKKSKTTNNILLLCNAYMKTNSPSKAVEVLRTANSENPKNEKITEYLGKALRMMGDPDGALECYEDDIRNHPWHQSIRVELIKIYIDLNLHDKATSLLNRSINDFDNIEVATSDILATKFSLLLMLAEVHEASNHMDRMREVILSAKEIICNKAVCCESMFAEGSDNRKKLSDLFCRIADYCEGKEDFLGAEEMIKDALDIQCDDESILLRLGKVYLSQNEFEQCFNITTKLASSSEGALQLHGDLLIAQSHLDDACSVYMKLLALNPVNYIVVETCLSLLYRLGRADEVQQLIYKAESLDNDPSSPGLLFSKGAMFLYQNKYLDSFHFFNLVRKHKIWGPKAMSRMIHILLHYQELSQLSCFENTASTQERHHMITARMLVSELEEIETNDKCCYNIRGYVHFCSGELDPAVNVFSEVLALDNEYVPSLLGLAKTLFPTSSSKARNILKKIAQLPHREEYHREFETCYLMLAEQYIAKDKVDHALELLNAVNARNKSCSKSWSLIGDLDQSKGSFLEAADSYAKAWKISRETDFVSGYKTALNYYKAKKTVQSIEVCEEVLSLGVHFKEVNELMLHHCVQSIRP